MELLSGQDSESDDNIQTEWFGACSTKEILEIRNL